MVASLSENLVFAGDSDLSGRFEPMQSSYNTNSRLFARPRSPTISYLFDVARYFKLTKGRALLYGPGSIHHAHSRIEKIGVTELKDAIEAYKKIARSCLAMPPL